MRNGRNLSDRLCAHGCCSEALRLIETRSLARPKNLATALQGKTRQPGIAAPHGTPPLSLQFLDRIVEQTALVEDFDWSGFDRTWSEAPLGSSSCRYRGPVHEIPAYAPLPTGPSRTRISVIVTVLSNIHSAAIHH